MSRLLAALVSLVLLAGCATNLEDFAGEEPASQTPPAGTATAPSDPNPAPAPVPPRPGVREAAFGQVFQLRIGEMIGIAGEDLVVTFLQVLSDNRCPPGVQCVVAGNARISVLLASDSDPSLTLQLNTSQEPRSGRYLDRTVELVGMSFGDRPAASLRVS